MQGELFSQPQAQQGASPEQIPLLDGCSLTYWPCFIANHQQYFKRLLAQLHWQQNQLRFAGKTHDIPRLEAFYADAGLHYSYSGQSMQVQPWQPLLSELKNQVMAHTASHFNAVLCNYYRDGNDSVSYHADDEPELGSDPIIASLSFGAQRRFHVKHNVTGARVSIDLASGSLLLMNKGVQKKYKHAVNKVKQADPRINLTFRQIIL